MTEFNIGDKVRVNRETLAWMQSKQFSTMPVDGIVTISSPADPWGRYVLRWDNSGSWVSSAALELVERYVAPVKPPVDHGIPEEPVATVMAIDVRVYDMITNRKGDLFTVNGILEGTAWNAKDIVIKGRRLDNDGPTRINYEAEEMVKVYKRRELKS